LRKLLVLVIATIFALLAIPTAAQELTPEVEVGAGYENPDGVDNPENIIGSVLVRGISFKRLAGGVILEARFVDGEFHTRVYTRSEVTLMGKTYAALDTALNGDWDPRAVVGLQLEKWAIEGYSQVDGDKSFGFVIRWRLF